VTVLAVSDVDIGALGDQFAERLRILGLQLAEPPASGTKAKTRLRTSFLDGSSTSALIGATNSRALSSVKVKTMNTPATMKNMYMVSRLAGIRWSSTTSNRITKKP